MRHQDTWTRALWRNLLYEIHSNICTNYTLDVIPLCNAKADLRNVPMTEFRTDGRGNVGQEFYIADFIIKLMVDNSRLKIFLDFDGMEYETG
jgi:hypothetical protein